MSSGDDVARERFLQRMRDLHQVWSTMSSDLTLRGLARAAGIAPATMVSWFKGASVPVGFQSWLAVVDAVAQAWDRQIHDQPRPDVFDHEMWHALRAGVTRSATQGWSVSQSADLHSHWMPRARGLEPEADLQGWYFTGRRQALQYLASVLSGTEAHGGGARGRVLMVTGAPGTGKSSLLAHLSVLSDPVLRQQMPQVYRSAVPQAQPGLVGAAVHARGKKLPQVVEEIAVAAGIAATGSHDLISGLAARGRPFTVVVDSLDEAEEESIASIARLLAALALDVECVGIRVVVGVRRAVPHSRLEEAIRLLGSKRVMVAVDEEPYLQEADVASYVRQRLLRVSDAEPSGHGLGRASTPYRGRERLARRVALAVARRARGNFLIAQLVSLYLANESQPVDTARRHWSAQFPDTVERAIAAYLERLSGQGDGGLRERDLLMPLVFARGEGLPAGDLWARAASELSRPRREYVLSDVHALLDSAATYLTDQGGEGTYRLYHAAMEQYLRSLCRVPQPERVVAGAFLDRDAAGGADWSAADPYLLRHGAEHAAQGGTDMLDELVRQPSYLVHAVPDHLLPVLARAGDRTRRTAEVYERVAHRFGTQPGERAAYLVLSARQLGAQDLAQSLLALGLRMPWVVRAAWWMPAAAHRVLASLPVGTRMVRLAPSDPVHSLVPLLIVSGDGEGGVQLRQWADDVLAVDERHRRHPGGVSALAVAPRDDGRWEVWSGDQAGGLGRWHIDDGLLIPAGPVLADTHAAEITGIGLGVGPDGQVVAVSADGSGAVAVWAGGDERAHALHQYAAGDRVTSVAVCSGPRRRWAGVLGLVDGGLTVLVNLHQAPRVAASWRLPGGWTVSGTSVHFDGDQIVVWAAGGDGSVWQFTVTPGGGVEAVTMTGALRQLTSLDVAASRIVLGSGAGQVGLWSSANGNMLSGDLQQRHARLHEGAVLDAIALDSSDGEQVASVGEDRRLVAWSVRHSPRDTPLGADDLRFTCAASTPTSAGSLLALTQREDRRTLVWAVDETSFTEIGEGTGAVASIIHTTSTDGRSIMLPARREPGAAPPLPALRRRPLAVAGFTLLAAAQPLGGAVTAVTATTSGELSQHVFRDGRFATIGGPRQGQSLLCDLALASSSANLLLATGNVEGCIELWLIRDGDFQQLPAESGALGGDAYVAVIDARLEDPLLLTANAVDGTLGFLAPLSNRAGVAERWPAGHTHPITAIAGVRHHTGDILIASGDRHGDVLLCRGRADGTDPRPISRLRLGARILDIHLAPDGSGVIWSSQGGLYLTLTPDPTGF